MVKHFIHDYEGINGFDCFSQIIKVFSTLLFQLGYILVHIGCIPASDVNPILVQHLLGAAVSSVSFLALGYPLAFGEDQGGILGVNTWLTNRDLDLERGLTGWYAASLSTSIIQTVIAGRVHTIANIIIMILSSGLVQPMVMHWLWDKNGWTQTYGWYFSVDVQYTDWGSSSTIHLYSGSFALGALLILGQRLSSVIEVDDSSVPINSQATMTTGYISILLGLVGNSYGTSNTMHYLMNNLIALTAGIITTGIFELFRKSKLNYWMAVWMLQSAAASIVTVTAGNDKYSIGAVVVVSTLGGIIYYTTSRLMKIWGLNDYCNLVAVHFICAIFGIYILPFHYLQTLSTTEILVLLSWQMICSSVISFAGLLFATVILINLQCIGILRNDAERKCYNQTVKQSGNWYTRICLCCGPVRPNEMLQLESHTVMKIDEAKTTDLIKNTTDLASLQKIPPPDNIREVKDNIYFVQDTNTMFCLNERKDTVILPPKRLPARFTNSRWKMK